MYSILFGSAFAIILTYNIGVRACYGEMLFEVINTSLTNILALSAFLVSLMAYKDSNRVKLSELLEELISTTKDIQIKLSTSQKKKNSRRRR